MHPTAAPHHAPGDTPARRQVLRRIKRRKHRAELAAFWVKFCEARQNPQNRAARRSASVWTVAHRRKLAPDHPARIIEDRAAAIGRANPLPAETARARAVEAGESESLATFTDEQWRLAGASMRTDSVQRIARQRQAFTGLLTDETPPGWESLALLRQRIPAWLLDGHRPGPAPPRARSQPRPPQRLRRLVLLISGTLTAAPPALPSRAAAGLILAA